MSSTGPDYKKIAIVLGGTAVVAAVAYYLFKEDDAKASKGVSSEPAGRKAFRDMNKQDSVDILNEVIHSQGAIKAVVDATTREVLESNLNLEQAYELIKQRLPQDPVEKRGLTLQQFDQLLDTHKNEPDVKERISIIMSDPSNGGNADAGKKMPPRDKVVEIHEFMKAELEELVKQCKPNMESKPVTVAAQTVLAAKVLKKFGFTSDELEAGVRQHYSFLGKDERFTKISADLQTLMTKLMGSHA